MTDILNSRWARAVFAGLGLVLVSAIAIVFGRYATTQPMLVLAAGAACLALGVTAVEPAAIPLAIMPLLLVSYRIGAGGVGLSVSDAALAVATASALVFAPKPFSRDLRTMLWLNAGYQFATLFTVLANPYTSNTIEWFHAWMLVSGALLVGWTIGARGKARLGVALLVLTALCLAVLTLMTGIPQLMRRDFAPVYLTWPFGMHKNFVGTVLAFAAAAAYARPEWLGWSKTKAMTAFWILGAGLMVTQSRQAIVGLGVAVILIALRGGTGARRRSRLILLAVIPALALVATLVKDQVQSNNQFNSVFTRLNWFVETTAFWLTSPWLGHGLRFWYQDGSEIPYQPPNAFLEVLASAGVLGLVAFVIMLVGMLRVTWRLDPRYGTMAVVVLASRLVQSQLDLFWVGVQTSVPFVIVGICLGAASRKEPARKPRSLQRNEPIFDVAGT